MVISLERLFAYGPAFASYKSRLVVSFWYRLTQVVLEKRPLNGRSSSSSVTIKLQRCLSKF